MSEWVGGSFVAGSANRVRDVKYPESAETVSSDAEFIPRCLAAEPELWEPTGGRYWMYQGFLHAHYNHNGTPNDPRPSCGCDVTLDIGVGLYPPRSFHPGAVNVLFGDGHIEAVTDSINANTWTALGTHDSGD